MYVHIYRLALVADTAPPEDDTSCSRAKKQAVTVPVTGVEAGHKRC